MIFEYSFPSYSIFHWYKSQDRTTVDNKLLVEWGNAFGIKMALDQQ